ncbi:MAG: flagellar motor switch protein FliN, partial [Spirochaetia bacterium]|nr:flagellar motor switch protein FliN [Spirochaetia bacterium]
DAPSGGGASAGGGGGSAGGADDLNLDSLLGGDGGGAGLDAASLSALAGAVGGGKPAPSGGGGGGRTAVASEGSRDNVELLLDVTLRFTVELGRTQMYIKDVLLLGEGSIVELDKNVGDEVDILINDRLFGRGRLVVMDEFFAVHITQIIDPLIRYRAM